MKYKERQILTMHYLFSVINFAELDFQTTSVPQPPKLLLTLGVSMHFFKFCVYVAPTK